MEEARGFGATVAALYVAARTVSLAILFIVEHRLRKVPLAAGASFRGWRAMLTRWDAVYYRIIATQGYPRTIPIDTHGNVTQNEWAFFPVFPYVTRAVMRVTTLEFATAAFVVNVLAGLIAALCLASLVRRLAGTPAALAAVALWSFFPTAFILQVPYSEAIYVAVASALLLALARARFGLAALLLLVAGLCRGYLLPLSAAAVVAVAARIRADAAAGSRDGARAWWARLVNDTGAAWLLIVAVAAPFLWMAMVSVATGWADGYARTQRAWGYAIDPVLWLSRWPDTVRAFGADTGATIGILVLGGAGGLMLIGLRTAMPVFVKAYMVVATLMLFMLALPQSVAFGSLPRFTLGILTLPAVAALTIRRRTVILMVVVAFTALQYIWVLNVWSGRLGVAP